MIDGLKMKNIRVRFPPSPTGELHLGGLRTALYNYLFARKNKGVFVLRIEDTDKEREVAGAAARLAKVLESLGLHYDEGPVYAENGDYEKDRGTLGPYIQSKRLEIYKKAAYELIKKGKAYWCDCSSARLLEMRTEQQKKKIQHKYDGRCREKGLNEEKGSVIRLKTPKKQKIEFIDVVHGKICVNSEDLDDQVLLKSDGYPTYHLAVVVDDNAMQISHVIRGADWLPSTPKHILLYRALGYELPRFAHLPLLKSQKGGKLSKREGDGNVQKLLDSGYLAEAIINFCALLGWNPKGDQELYAIDELIKSFDLPKINKSPASINFEKLDWMNREHLRTLEPRHFLNHALPILMEQGLVNVEEDICFFPKTDLSVSRDQLSQILLLGLERSHDLAGAIEEVKFFFVKPKQNKNLLPWKKQTGKEVGEILKKTRDSLKAHDNWNAGDIVSHLKTFCTDNALDIGSVFWPFRVALSGQKGSVAPEIIAELIGKEETLRRIDDAIKTLS